MRSQPVYQPSNVTWAWLPPHENRRLKKRDRYAALAERALAELEHWLTTAPLAQPDCKKSPSSLALAAG